MADPITVLGGGGDVEAGIGMAGGVGGDLGDVLMCVECRDVPAVVYCGDCEDDPFCGLCWKFQHRRGKRRAHETRPTEGATADAMREQLEGNAAAAEGTTAKFMAELERAQQMETSAEADAAAAEAALAAEAAATADPSQQQGRGAGRRGVRIDDGAQIADRARYIPVRLTFEERSLLQILEGALEVSEYTSNVDVSSNMYGYFWSMGVSKKSNIIKHQLREVLSFVSGLYVSSDFKSGQKLVSDRGFAMNEEFFRSVFEIGRRYKIMNPDKMRTTYGKLMFICQDAVTPGMLDLDVKDGISTVGTFLEDRGGEAILHDPRILDATRVVESSASAEVTAEAQIKREAREAIVEEYATAELPRDDILLALDSLSDSNSYIVANRLPVDRMIEYLRMYFDPHNETDKTSLAIRAGRGGSFLSHSHKVQYTFVMQSLQLWREIQHEMFKLWIMADADLLSESSSYRLMNTGQGLNRVQPAPKVSATMSRILSTVKSRVGGWVGLSVVHLGDRDVPNALVFIDKYTQVPRILAPIVRCIERIGELENDPDLAEFVAKYGGVENLRLMILRDYFRHGFDGSGDDGGSCIDGRLTSSWNWTSKIEKKPYFPVFLLTGFTGFDGDF